MSFRVNIHSENDFDHLLMLYYWWCQDASERYKCTFNTLMEKWWTYISFQEIRSRVKFLFISLFIFVSWFVKSWMRKFVPNRLGKRRAHHHLGPEKHCGSKMSNLTWISLMPLNLSAIHISCLRRKPVVELAVLLWTWTAVQVNRAVPARVWPCPLMNLFHLTHYTRVDFITQNVYSANRGKKIWCLSKGNTNTVNIDAN